MKSCVSWKEEREIRIKVDRETLDEGSATEDFCSKMLTKVNENFVSQRVDDSCLSTFRLQHFVSFRMSPKNKLFANQSSRDCW